VRNIVLLRRISVIILKSGLMAKIKLLTRSLLSPISNNLPYVVDCVKLNLQANENLKPAVVRNFEDIILFSTIVKPLVLSAKSKKCEPDH
jgi:hypothetical protein